MNATLFIQPVEPLMSITTGYIMGAIVSILLLGYLIYTLIKPEKF